MNRVLVMCLLLQVVYGARNFSLTIGTGRESPAGVTYVDGKAPEDLKAGPGKNETERIVHAAIIQSSARHIPKDDEVENEEFERFIKEHLNRPSIETVFVSSKPATNEEDEKEAEDLKEEEPRSQAEFFKHPTEAETFQRSIALPTIVPTVDSNSHELPINIAIPTGYPGGDGFIVHSDSGSYSDGHYLVSNGGGQFLHYGTPLSTVVPVQSLIPQTTNVAQHALKTKTFEIRRPAIQKHYYDIEERVIIRPAGSIIVELDRPVAKIPTGETIVAYNGGQGGGFNGYGIQQSQGGSGTSQGGIGIAIGGPQGGLAGVGVQQSQGGPGGNQDGRSGAGGQQPQGGIGIAVVGPQGGLAGFGIQQSQGGPGVGQGGFSGTGGQQSQGGIGIAIGGPQGGPQGGFSGVGITQSQGGFGIAQAGPQGGQQGGPQGGFSRVGITQSQGGFGIAQGGPQGGLAGVGVTQSQGGVGIAQTGPGGVSYSTTISTPVSSAGVGGSQSGVFGPGLQPSGVSFSTTITTPASSVSIGGTQAGIGGIGVQQSQGGVAISTTPGPTVNIAGSRGGFQQNQGSVGIAQSGPQGAGVGIGIQQSQGGIGVTNIGPQGAGAGVGVQQSQGAIGVAQSGPQGSTAGFGIQQSQGGIGVTTSGPQGAGTGFGIQQSQGGIGIIQGGTAGVGIQQGQGGVFYSTTPNPFYTSVTPSPGYTYEAPQGGFFITSSYPTSPSPSPTPTIVLRSRRPSYPLISTTPGSIIATTPNPDYNRDNAVVVEARSNVQNRGSFSSSTTTERSFSVSEDASAYARGSSSSSVQAASKNITPYMITVGEPNFNYPPYVEIRSNGLPLGHLHQFPYHQSAAFVQPYPRMRYQGGLLTGEVNQAADESEPVEGYGALSKTYQESPAHVVEVPPSQHHGQQSEYHQPGETQTNHNEHQHYVGSPPQPLQTSQTSGSSHQQPAQVYQHNYLRATSQPITIPEATQASVTHRPTQQHFAHGRPNLVIQTLHRQQQEQQRQQFRNAEDIAPQQHIPEVTPHTVEVKEISSSTHRNPSTLYEQQLVSSTLEPEPLVTGRRLYQQQPVPVKYTQDHSINVAPVQHDVLFRSPHHQSVDHGRKQNLETPRETAESHDESPHSEASTTSAPQHIAPQNHNPTYASVIANSNQPDIIYASPGHVDHRPQHSLRFSSAGSPLFSSGGRQLHFAYSQPSHAAYSHQALLTPSAAILRPAASASPVETSQPQEPQHRQVQFSVNAIKESSPSIAASLTSGKHHVSLNSGDSRSQSNEPFQRQVHHPVHSVNSFQVESQSTHLPAVGSSSHSRNPTLFQRQIQHSTNYAPSNERQVQHPVHSVNSFQAESQSTHFPVVGGSSHSHNPTFFQRQIQHSTNYVPSNERLQSGSGHAESQRLNYFQRQTQHSVNSVPTNAHIQSTFTHHNSNVQPYNPASFQRQILSTTSVPSKEPNQSESHSTHHVFVSSTTPASVTSTTARYEQPVVRGSHKYRNEQTHGAITLRSGRTYGEQRVIASTPAPKHGSIASESVQTRRIVVNHPFQTVQEVVEQEPITKIHQVVINRPAPPSPPAAPVTTTLAPATAAALTVGLQKDHSNAPNRPAAYKLAVDYNHPGAALSFQHHG